MELFQVLGSQGAIVVGFVSTVAEILLAFLFLRSFKIIRRREYGRLKATEAQHQRCQPEWDRMFSLDNGAVIGLEYRFGITSNLQAGIHRSLLSKTIMTFGRWDAIRQSESMPIGLSVTGSFEGLNNLQQNRQPGIAVTVSRTFGERLALYATPAFVGNTKAVDFISGHEGHDHGLDSDLPDEHAHHNDTWFAGLGGRVRFSETGYITGEYTPRLHGYDPNRGEWGVGVEKRTHGHTLQLNLTNSFGTTFGQLARGGSPHDVYLGFNITRRF